MNRRLVHRVSAAAATVAVLAVASYMTTQTHWDSGGPTGEFRIRLRDSEGRPIEGAVMRVHHSGTKEPTDGMPIDNHTSIRYLVSDPQGRITAIRNKKGSPLQYGGTYWDLFWVIPMGNRSYRFDCDCEIIADGFGPIEFRFTSLYEVSPVPVKGGGPSIYEHEFVMERVGG